VTDKSGDVIVDSERLAESSGAEDRSKSCGPEERSDWGVEERSDHGESRILWRLEPS